MHQPNVFVNTFYGYIMWDYESDAPFMWPEKQRYPTIAEAREILDRNPEEAAIRGKWSDPEFLRNVSSLNPQAQGHAVRRLPRPRLEFPRGVQARPQGHAARRQGQRGRRRRSRRSSRRPCTCRRSTWISACSASTATSRRTATATATSTARWRPRSRSTAPIATAPSASIRRSSPAAPRRSPAGATSPCCARRTAASASNGATASSTSARRSIRTRNGR